MSAVERRKRFIEREHLVERREQLGAEIAHREHLDQEYHRSKNRLHELEGEIARDQLAIQRQIDEATQTYEAALGALPAALEAVMAALTTCRESRLAYDQAKTAGRSVGLEPTHVAPWYVRVSADRGLKHLWDAFKIATARTNF